MKTYSFFIALITILLSGQPVHADYDWRDIDRTGLYKNKDEGQLKRNLWNNYTQDEAVELLKTWPKILRHASYRQLAKHALVSNAPHSSEEITSPALLSERLQTLIDYGLINEAQMLFKIASDDESMPKDFGLSLIGLQFILLNGELAPMCLDVQAASSDFRDMPAWRELSKFCRYRFGTGEKVNLKDVTFKQYPALKTILADQLVTIDDTLSSMAILIAYADNKISDDLYEQLAKSPGDQRDLIIFLGTKEKYSNQKTHQCYAIESVKRGLRTNAFLEESYKNHKFNEGMMSRVGGDITLHPCDIPAYFYQKMQSDTNDDNKNQLMANALTVTESLPLTVMVPLMNLANGYSNNNNDWRTSILQTYISMDTVDKGKADSNVFAYPLKQLINKNHPSLKEYKNWLNAENHRELMDKDEIDTAMLLYLLQINSGDINNLSGKSKNIEYENLFSLTYVDKSIHLGIGFNDFMSDAYDKDNHVFVISHALKLLGKYDIKNIHPQDMAVILSTLKAYKLEKETIALVLEYLQ